MAKILLVDDEACVTATVAAKLARGGHEVLVASDGAEGARLAREQLPAVVVSDLQMPALNGYEMAVQLRSDPATAHVPLILLTGRGHLLTPSQLAQTRIVQVIEKPFSARELVAKVEELLAETARNASAARAEVAA